MPEQSDYSYPEAARFAPTTASYYYGAADVAARYCGLASTPTYTCGVWQHGWVPSFMQFAPHSLFGQKFLPNTWLWVADEAGKQLCLAAGLARVEAIGLPIAYVPTPEVARERGTLLVMPVHAGLAADYQWDEEAYAAEITRVATRFAKVVVCVHALCAQKGYWVKTFQRHGFEVIQGATADDRNSLLRLVRNFARFEFITTNGFGSHIAYGAYLGAKVSIFGPYAHTPEALEADVQDAYYRDHPEVIPLMRERMSFDFLSRALSPFFRPPHEAVDMTDWGREQVGYACRRPPAELIRLFKWDRAHQAGHRLVSWLPQGVAGRIRARARNWLK